MIIVIFLGIEFFPLVFINPFAVLQVVGPSGAPNTEKQARLQFYEPMTRMRLQTEETGGIEVSCYITYVLSFLFEYFM